MSRWCWHWAGTGWPTWRCCGPSRTWSGRVASDPTVSRLIATFASSGNHWLNAICGARSHVRERVWAPAGDAAPDARERVIGARGARRSRPVDRTGNDRVRLVRCVERRLFDSMEMGNMPLKGEYEPSTMQLVRDQVELYESSGGREGTTLSSLVGSEDAKRRDLPVVILTTLGAKSGKIRKSPLMRVEHDGSYAVVASLGGAPKHPVWYHNVVADPRVELQDGPVRQDMLAREVTGDEKAVWWARAVEAFPDYAEYQKKTDREIPVFVLEPAAEEH